MKKKTIIFILIAAALAIGVGISIKRYWIREAGSGAQALWHDDECFVFVSVYSMGWSGSLLEEVLVPIGEKLDIIRDLPEPLGSSLTLYHYTEGRLETHDLKDQYLGQQFTIFNGQLHCLNYGDDEEAEGFASGWRWTESGFEALSEREVKEVAGSFGKEDEDPIKKAGWSRADVAIFSLEPEENHPIHLRSGELTLTMKSEGRSKSLEDFELPSKTTIALSGPGIAQPVLREFSYDWQKVDEARYQKVAGARARNQTLFGRRTIFLGLGGLLIYLIHTVVSLVGMKGKVVKAVPQNFQFLPATPDQFPALDAESLRRYTEAFESLGFVRLRDYTMADDSMTFATSFGRLFANRERGCFAEVGQVFPKGKKPMPMGCMIGSLMEDGWSLATTDRQPQALSYMMRRPRALWTSHPRSRPTELMHLHLERRRQIAYELGVKVIEDVSAENFFAHERREAADRQQALKRRNLAVGLSEAAAFKLKPKHEWMGEYPNVAARKKEPWKYARRA